MPLDVNLDGLIDMNDVLAIASHFGEQSCSGSASASKCRWLGRWWSCPVLQQALMYTVPEPLTMGLMLAGLLAAGGWPKATTRLTAELRTWS